MTWEATNQVREKPEQTRLQFMSLHPTFFLSFYAARKVWEHHFADVDAVIYLVDSADRERIPESKKELDELLSHPALETVPFLILGNKIDSRQALSEQEMRAELGLVQTTGKEGTALEGVRPIELFMCSVAKRNGYQQGKTFSIVFPSTSSAYHVFFTKYLFGVIICAAGLAWLTKYL